MAVERYQGQNVTAEPAENYIDIKSIIACCDIFKNLSEELTKVSANVLETSYICSKENLSIKGKEYQSVIEECSNKLDYTHKYMQNFTEEILKATQRALDKKQTELNEIAKKLDLIQQ